MMTTNDIRAFEKAARNLVPWHGWNKSSWRDRWHKLFNFPFRYPLYQVVKRFPRAVQARTFWGAPFFCYLPDYFFTWQYGVIGHPAEMRLTAYVLRTLKEGEVFLDLGASCGFYSLLADRIVGDRGAVYAFEPTKPVFEMLKKNTQGHSRITIEELAVTDRSGTATIQMNHRSPVANSLTIVADGAQPLSVGTISLDEYCVKKSITPNFIKIDVEGAEELVIRGARELLRRTSPIISMEMLKESDGAHVRAALLLIELGYHPYAMLDGGVIEPVEMNSDGTGFVVKDGCDNFIFKKS